jgi:hypothetical protein
LNEAAEVWQSFKRLRELCDEPWNSALFDPLQNAGMAVEHRPQAFFSDDEIKKIPSRGLSGPWQQVVVLGEDPIALYQRPLP